MNNTFGTSLIRFVVLVVLQVTVFNSVALHNLINPFVYILIILMFPFRMPHWQLILAAFGTGLIIDIFSDTAGLHAGASALVGFLRPFWLRNILKSEVFSNQSMTFKSLSNIVYLTYIAFLVLVHNLYLFVVEAFSLMQLPFALLKTLISTVVTVVILMIIRLVSNK
jgi:rod shape-determining protein MreD